MGRVWIAIEKHPMPDFQVQQPPEAIGVVSMMHPMFGK